MKAPSPLVIAALFIVLATSCSGGADGCGSGGGGAVCAAAATTPARNAAAASLLPRTTGALPSFDPASYDRLLSQLRGTPAVVNIWASWCGPCRDEAPLLADAARTYGRRVQFLGIDIQDARESARQFMQQYGWTYPSVYDATGAIRDQLGFLGQPSTIFYDRSGAVAGRANGTLTPELLKTSIEGILP
jgi:cytochrome c biogenesis protein CcmG, thiol:disulfide interchange protein DsbE